jgi:hypothetical protein
VRHAEVIRAKLIENIALAGVPGETKTGLVYIFLALITAGVMVHWQCSIKEVDEQVQQTAIGMKFFSAAHQDTAKHSTAEKLRSA